jgi:hypothetical protein
VAVLALRDGLSNAIFNTTTKKLEFPASVPKTRFPQKGLKKGRKGLMASLNSKFVAAHPQEGIVDMSDMCLEGFFPVPTNQDPDFVFVSFPSRAQVESEISSTNDNIRNGNRGFSLKDSESFGQPVLHTQVLRGLLSIGLSPMSLYVDSGAGQSLCSAGTAFAQMLPCQVEITGIAGALQIYGCGTALFLSDDGLGNLAILRVNNCLYGHCQFSLLSVSQICQQPGNAVDFTLGSPVLVLRSTGAKRRELRLPLSLDDGLFALSVTPFQLDDPRYHSLPKFDVTPAGEFQLSDDSSHRWSSKVLVSASSTARILASYCLILTVI